MTKLLSVKAAADRIGGGEDFIRKMMASGALTTYSLGRRMTRISEAELEAWIEQCRVSGESSDTGAGSQQSEDAETVNNVVRLERLIASELSKQSGA